MLELDSPFWADLTHAYGRASENLTAPRTWSNEAGFGDLSTLSDISSLLRQLEEHPTASLGEQNAESWHSLWSALCPQGDVYTASYAAVPHLVRIGAAVDGLPGWQFFGLPTCIEIGRIEGRGPAFPEMLADAYRDALRGLHDLAHRLANREWDELLSRSIASALVVTKGHTNLGEAILELNPDNLEEFRRYMDPIE